ncbi:MAG TPA: pilus assembly protein PilM [Solirubrobacteraceae bacterium]|jgi:type IV pilus assembly protein PilM|nr:pilus assembly protein PilM [Solirubrobacteraceae bacterium]
MSRSLNLNMTIGRGGGDALVGLDIQPGLIAAVQARVNGSLLVERAVGAPLGSDVVREGDVVDSAALSDALRKLFAGSRLSKRVRIGVANQRTVMRTIELPPVTDRKDLAAAVQFQAQDQVPMPLANAVLDFHPLGIVDTPGGPRQRVVLVAAQRDMVERLLAAVRSAGLTPAGVDMSAFAMIRSLYRGGAADRERVLYLNVDGLTNVAIAEGTVCRFTRVLGGGVEELASQLAERRAIPLEHARGLLADVDLTAPAGADAPGDTLPEEAAAPSEAASAGADGATPATELPDAVAPSKIEPAGEPPHREEPQSDRSTSYEEELAAPSSATAAQEARAVLENGVRAIAGEVRNSLDFQRSQEGGADVSRVVLSGSALELAGFAHALQASLGVEVVAETVNVSDSNQVRGLSPHRFAVAAGLAVSEVGS